MVEIFADIPERVRIQSKFWVDLALKQKNAFEAIKMIEEYRNSCLNDEEREFLDFYFNLRMEQLKNERASN